MIDAGERKAYAGAVGSLTPRMKSNLPVQTLSPHRRFLMSVVWVIAFLNVIQLGLALFIIPRFGVIFADMLPDQKLPVISSVMIQGRWTIAGLACLVPAMAWMLVRSPAPPRLTATVLAIGLCWSVFQVPLTASALLMPFQRLVQSLSVSGETGAAK